MNAFGLRRQSASGDGAFETERRVRPARPARSFPHARKRLRAALAAAVQNWPRAFWTAPAERQRRRRFRNGAARSTGQTRSVVTTRRKRLRAALAAALQNWPRAFWTAPAERQRRRRFRNGAARSTGQTRSVVTTRSKAVSRSACHRTPKLAEGVLDCAGRAAAATALSKRSGAFDRSDPLGRYHTPKAASRCACRRSPK